MLKVGTKAPEFTLQSHTGDSISLSDYNDKKYVALIFYPGDETPVCIKQLCELRDDYSQFEKLNAVVFGVNPADIESHGAFAKKHNFQFPLLVDNDGAVTKAFGCKGTLMTKRTVYVIDPKGMIIFAQRGKPPVSEIRASIEKDRK